MRKIIYTIVLLSTIVVSACRKSDTGNLPDGMIYLNQPHIVKETGDPAILDTDPLGFEATFSVDLYHKNSDKPDYLDIVVVKNGDAKNAKVVKADVNSYPTSVSITGQQLTDLFGTILSGDNFDVGADYIKGGTRYVAFPDGGGAAYGPGTSSQPGGSPTVRYSAICGFIADDFVGEFEVTLDPWADFGVGTIVEVVKVDESTIEITYPIPGFNPITLDVNVGDNTVVVERQPLGDYGGNWAYGVVSIASTGGGTANYVNPCNGVIRINGAYTVAAGSFGAFALELKKVE